MSDPALEIMIGTTTGNMQTFYDLGVDLPFQEAFVPYGVEVDAADALVYGHGFATAIQRWGFISQAQRDILKIYCAGKSATVYIRIHGEDWSYVYCKATMIWQPEQPPDNGYILDFSILYRILVNYGSSLP